MIFLLDTNVVSERTKATPSARVADFLRAVPAENIRVSSIVVAEVAQGVANNPTPALQKFLADVLTFPVADFGEFEALEWGTMTSQALLSGPPLKMRDSLIAATASARGWTVATRDTTDFSPFGVKLFNPWTDTL